MLRKRKGALFDLGSTLIEYENIPWSELFRMSLERAYGYLPAENIVRPDFDDFYQAFLDQVVAVEEKSDETQIEIDIFEVFSKFLSHFNMPNDSEFLDRFLRNYYSPVRENMSLKENALETLKYFNSHGHKIGLISNTVFPPEFHQEDMRSLDIEQYFDEIIFSSDFHYRKPHPSIYNKMLRMLDISASEAFFTGDRIEIDVLGAKTIGMFSVLLKKKGRKYEDIETPDLVIENLIELLEYY
jgi:FMN phosphatase YigB (HAD superfamily)